MNSILISIFRSNQPDDLSSSEKTKPHMTNKNISEIISKKLVRKLTNHGKRHSKDKLEVGFLKNSFLRKVTDIKPSSSKLKNSKRKNNSFVQSNFLILFLDSEITDNATRKNVHILVELESSKKYGKF